MNKPVQESNRPTLSFSLPHHRVLQTIGLTFFITGVLISGFLLSERYLSQAKNQTLPAEFSPPPLSPVVAVERNDSLFGVSSSSTELLKEEIELPVEEQYVDTWNSIQAFFNKRRDLYLHWSTKSNYPKDLFEVERSRTLDKWTSFAKVESIRNPGMLRFFSLVDSSLQKGSTFYRIKKIKPNGDSTFSKVLQVHIP